MKDVNFWVKKMSLLPHPEGGYYKESYRCEESVGKNCVPERFPDKRNWSTAIYYLLESGDFSAFHRIKSDEIWHFYDGDPLAIYIINIDGNIEVKKLGISESHDILPQIVVPANSWFAALPLGSYTLAGCTVSPGFDFSDFEMAKKEILLNKYPDHSETIKKLTH